MSNVSFIMYRDLVLLPKNIKDELIKYLKDIKPEEVWLFGSYAKENQSQSSDIDIFVVKKRDKKKLHDNIIEIRKKLLPFEKKYGTEVDLFVDVRESIDRKLTANDPFYTSVFKEGVKIYSKNEDKDENKPKTSKKSFDYLLFHPARWLELLVLGHPI